HPRRVPPDEKRLVVLDSFVDELEARIKEFLVDSLHALRRQRAGVLDFLCAVRIGPAVEYATRSKLFLKLRILRIVGVFWLLLRIQVIEIAEELIEAVHRREEFIPVAEVVLAELPAHVAERLQHIGDRRVFRLQSEVGAGKTDFGKAGTNRRLTCNECRAPRGAALLTVPVSEVRTFLGDAVDVGGPIPHDAVVVRADIEPADIVSPDDQNIWLAGLRHLTLRTSFWSFGAPAVAVQESGRGVLGEERALIVCRCSELTVGSLGFVAAAEKGRHRMS